MDNVINLTDQIAIVEVKRLLDLTRSEANNFFESLKSGKTMAESLRVIGIKSASEIGLDLWPSLRAWRNKYFPNNVKIK